MENYDYTFGIEYDNPQLYLVPSAQSDLKDSYVDEIIDIVGTPANDITGISIICNWFNSNFTFDNAGGEMIGKKTADELYESKLYYGCHSAALIISSVLRELGFPAVMIETASVKWAYDYFNNEIQYFRGHVMTEVYCSDKWILLDNNGMFVEEYDSINPFISTLDNEGLFAYAKGIDIWDYGVQDPSDTHDMMINFSDNLGCFEEKFNSVNYEWE
jgi:hypothetical protein